LELVQQKSDTRASFYTSNPIMIFKYFNMAAAALLVPFASALANSVQRRDQDFSWNITALEGYPTIDFDADSLSNNKFLKSKLFMADCKTRGTLGALTILNSTVGNELTLDVDVVQALIDPSDFYVKALDELSANITFCVRVDYMYIPFGSSISESVNFHETKVTISVDLTAGFQLTSINTERTAADEKAVDAELDYPVVAYYCDEENEELDTDPTYNQGDIMQVCIRIDDTLAEEDIFVEDIISFILSQGGDPALAATPTTAIQNRQTDPLTLKACGVDGRCNVKHQLTSKFFDDPRPGDLEINGIALIGLGTPNGPVARKLLRVPVRAGLLRSPRQQQESSRQLQSETESEFDLSAPLNPAIPPATEADGNDGNQGTNSDDMIIVLVAVVAAVFVCITTICISIMAVCCLRRPVKIVYRDDYEEEETSRECRIARSGRGDGVNKSTRTLQSSYDSSRSLESKYYEEETPRKPRVSSSGRGDGVNKSTRTTLSSHDSSSSLQSKNYEEETPRKPRIASSGRGDGVNKSSRTLSRHDSSKSLLSKEEETPRKPRSASGSRGDGVSKSTRTLQSSSRHDSSRSLQSNNMDREGRPTAGF
jgi:hypothetical protein